MPDSSANPQASVTVRVVYLARLREAFGTAGEALVVAAEAPTVGTVLAALRARGGVWAHELAGGRAVRAAVGNPQVWSKLMLALREVRKAARMTIQ